MLIQSEGARAGAAVLLRQDFFNKLYNKQQREAETFQEEEEEEERGLEIDLDYGEYVEVGIKDEEEEPLDLSMKSFARRRDEHEDTQQPADAPIDLHKPKLPRLELKPNFQIFNFDSAKKPEVAPAESTQENKSSFMTEAEVSRLLEPHVKAVLRKFVCTVCHMKFANRLKAVTHVENKHVDCLVYKCPLCRASKVTRLAYESHLRRGHGARPDQHRPLIKAKKKFSVRSAAEAGPASDQAAGAGHPTAAGGHCSYDLQFVTFLRHSLAGPALVTGAQWLDSAQDTDQAVFRVTNRETFARRWFAFKVKKSNNMNDDFM